MERKHIKMKRIGDAPEAEVEVECIGDYFHNGPLVQVIHEPRALVENVQENLADVQPERIGDVSKSDDIEVERIGDYFHNDPLVQNIHEPRALAENVQEKSVDFQMDQIGDGNSSEPEYVEGERIGDNFHNNPGVKYVQVHPAVADDLQVERIGDYFDNDPQAENIEVDHIDDYYGNGAVVGDVQKSSDESDEPSSDTYYVTDLTEAEYEVVDLLEDIYSKTLDINTAFQIQINQLEFGMEKERDAINAERKALLEKIREPNSGIPNYSILRAFWMGVLKMPFRGIMTKTEEFMLRHLIDVRSVLHIEPQLKFDLVFEFKPNMFFENTILTKTYYCCFEEHPKEFEICRCEGTKILWKDPKFDTSVVVVHIISPEIETKYVPCRSFFSFFSPPTKPEDDDRSIDAFYTRAILKEDYEMGYNLKEYVIPQAILFFTGNRQDNEYDENAKFLIQSSNEIIDQFKRIMETEEAEDDAADKVTDDDAGIENSTETGTGGHNYDNGANQESVVDKVTKSPEHNDYSQANCADVNKD